MISLPVLLCLYFVNVDIHALNGNARAFFHDVLHLVDDALHHSAYIHAVKHRDVEVYHQLVTPCADAYAALPNGGVIVLCGEYTLSEAFINVTNTSKITITSVYGDTDYAKTNGAKQPVTVLPMSDVK